MTIKIFDGAWKIAQTINVFSGSWKVAKKIYSFVGNDSTGYWLVIYPDLPFNTDIPDVIEPVYVGSTATLDNYFIWDFANNYRAVDTINYQWQRSANLSTWSNISGATSATYVVQSSDLDYYLRCLITATNERGSVIVTSFSSFQVFTVPGVVQSLSRSNPTQPFGPPSVVWDATWSAPSDDGGSAITDYEFSTDLDGDGSSYTWGPWISTSGDTFRAVLVLGGVVGKTRVRALNLAGAGQETELILDSSPSTPNNFSGTATSTTTATLTWSSPSYTGIGSISGYEFQRTQQPDPQTNWSDIGLVTSRNATGLNPSTTYYFRVRAYNMVGSTKIIGLTATTTVTTPATNPTSPSPSPSPSPAPTEPPLVTPQPPTSPPPAPFTPPPPPPPVPPSPIFPPPGPNLPTPQPVSPPVQSISYGTEILTPEGYIPIENILIGDELISIDIDEISTDGTNFDIYNWSSETFTNKGFVITNVTNISSSQITGPEIIINGDSFSDNHSILTLKNGVYSFTDAKNIDESYQIFDADIQDWTQVVSVEIIENSTVNVYSIDCEPYDIFFTNNALVYNKKEFINE